MPSFWSEWAALRGVDGLEFSLQKGGGARRRKKRKTHVKATGLRTRKKSVLKARFAGRDGRDPTRDGRWEYG